ncbi:MAG: hypothetical protein A3B10_00335 [Candidatus Doudnabacteria bacterium RIFCSPLOWO2_01_FULL_44_21]|uniref:Uncharacterized protein n=1 Tax=Candidatus Doudnabacteria bacterium RIFCSPLOWO2_01_FULL_44_21 TaxID=1817841 RepID=A0A1F5PXF3_9BACT|nr:MAG: hypothetical protein A3B95_03790 [Candidatus Doudnabacteria bacterium RIFCSPHIGHO2_02_FULL_43_13b]OGE94595.1 MAG: hypothetical protein A3B10_00335 [Candidatus Doudnabacteria bacterium RIFCSPLOWO2_01_FULL_44_21]
MLAELIYVHFEGRGMYLFEWHVHGLLLGNPIPKEYQVHRCDVEVAQGSVNLTMSNGGQPIDTEALERHLNKLGTFGAVKVGTFGTTEVEAVA